MKRALRRWQAYTHMRRRLHELRGMKWQPNTPRSRARFKEQPCLCSCAGCGNPRRHTRGHARLSIQELRERTSKE